MTEPQWIYLAKKTVLSVCTQQYSQICARQKPFMETDVSLILLHKIFCMKRDVSSHGLYYNPFLNVKLRFCFGQLLNFLKLYQTPFIFNPGKPIYHKYLFELNIATYFALMIQKTQEEWRCKMKTKSRKLLEFLHFTAIKNVKNYETAEFWKI